MRTPKKPSLPAPSEHQEQARFIEWCATANVIAIAIPNGGKRHIRTATRLKAEGVLPGVPDLFLPYKRLDFGGLWIEMKKRKGGKVSDAQAEVMTMLRRLGYDVRVCAGWEEAASTAWGYLQSSKYEWRGGKLRRTV